MEINSTLTLLLRAVKCVGKGSVRGVVPLVQWTNRSSVGVEHKNMQLSDDLILEKSQMTVMHWLLSGLYTYRGLEVIQR